jgi:hypothetical protein
MWLPGDIDQPVVQEKLPDIFGQYPEPENNTSNILQLGVIDLQSTECLENGVRISWHCFGCVHHNLPKAKDITDTSNVPFFYCKCKSQVNNAVTIVQDVVLKYSITLILSRGIIICFRREELLENNICNIFELFQSALTSPSGKSSFLQ